MIVRYTPRAEADLADIATYLLERSPSGARAVRASIERTIAALAIYPRLGRAQRLPGVRKAVVRSYPYAIYYRQDSAAGALDILAIRHTSRQSTGWE